MPTVWQREGYNYAKASAEQAFVEQAAGAKAPRIGEKPMLVPDHCDPTVNLYDWYVCVRGGRVESLWPITARGALLSQKRQRYLFATSYYASRSANLRRCVSDTAPLPWHQPLTVASLTRRR